MRNDVQSYYWRTKTCWNKMGKITRKYFTILFFRGWDIYRRENRNTHRKTKDWGGKLKSIYWWHVQVHLFTRYIRPHPNQSNALSCVSSCLKWSLVWGSWSDADVAFTRIHPTFWHSHTGLLVLFFICLLVFCFVCFSFI